MDLREKLLEAARPHHCGITDCQYCRWGREDVLKGARLALEACPCHCVPSGHPGELLYRCTRCCHLLSLSTEGGRG
jgi:hypothetical protein